MTVELMQIHSNKAHAQLYLNSLAVRCIIIHKPLNYDGRIDAGALLMVFLVFFNSTIQAWQHA